MEIDPFIFRLSIFILSIFIGYYVVWSVTPSLHTPLMSVTNAISSVITACRAKCSCETLFLPLREATHEVRMTKKDIKETRNGQPVQDHDYSLPFASATRIRFRGCDLSQKANAFMAPLVIFLS